MDPSFEYRKTLEFGVLVRKRNSRKIRFKNITRRKIIFRRSVEYTIVHLKLLRSYWNILERSQKILEYWISDKNRRVGFKTNVNEVREVRFPDCLIVVHSAWFAPDSPELLVPYYLKQSMKTRDKPIRIIYGVTIWDNSLGQSETNKGKQSRKQFIKLFIPYCHKLCFLVYPI